MNRHGALWKQACHMDLKCTPVGLIRVQDAPLQQIRQKYMTKGNRVVIILAQVF